MSRPFARALACMSLVVLAVASGSCSSGSQTDASDPDAGAVDASKTTLQVAPAKAPALARVLAIAAHDLHLRDTLAANAHGFKALPDADKGFASEGLRLHPMDGSRMAAAFPTYADARFRVGAGHIDRWSMHLSPIAAAHAAGVEDEGRVVYEGAWASTDLVVAAGQRGVEWILALRDENAPTSFAWTLELGKDLRLAKDRLPDGSIDFVDAEGFAALRIPPAFAVDAKGQKRDVKLEVAGGELRVALDREGLAYPILVDPVVSVPVWQLAKKMADAGGLATGRRSNAMAFHPASDGVLSIGGINSANAGITEVKAFTAGTTWNSNTALPSAAGYVAAAQVGGNVFAYGGCTDNACSTNLGALLVKPASGGWSSVCTGATCGPGLRGQAGLAAIGQQLVLFGGGRWDAPSSQLKPLGDTWLLDLSSGATTFTSVTVASPPLPRRGHVFVGAPSANVAMLFGGGDTSISTLYGDTWLWKKTGATTGTWECVCSCTLLTPSVPPCAQEPGPRAFASGAWDDARKKFVLFGGYALYGDGYGPSRGTWEFDPATRQWTPLCYEGGPDGCTPDEHQEAGAAFDPIRRKVVVAGGKTKTSYASGDTWTLYVRGGSCSSDAQCDTGHCLEGTCCETASCPVCQTCASSSSPGVCSNVAALAADPLGRCDACDGAGTCKKANGTSCSAGTECASGYCTDGTCCEASACGTGQTCADSVGKCRKVLGSSCTLSLECASGYCTDGTCCSSASCPSGARCDWASGAGSCRKNNGQSCTTTAECGSGYCVDGYCCNGACAAQCAACDVVKGTCTPVTGAPHGSRTACAGSGDCKSSCNGSDPSACKYPGSSISCGTASCTSSTATAPGTCDGAGACVQPTSSCGAYACGTTACKTSCSADTDCASGYFCSAGACTAKLAKGAACTAASQCSTAGCVNGVCCGTSSCASGYTCAGASAPGTCTKINGQACSAAADCASGNCVDGVCCDGSCTGQCQACNVTGNVGKCTTVLGAPVGGRTACSGTGAGTSCGPRCDGVNPSACSYPGATTSCGTPSCTSGAETGVSTCDGAGTCKPASKSCGAYVCGATACKTTCASNTDCASGYYCKAGACAAKEVAGTACVDGSSCASGNCVDGVCCTTSACSGGAKCNVAGTAGTCAKPNGVACASSAECGSGFCVDGVCCDTACSGQCQACDATGKVGTCTAVSGPPHGTRSACGGTGAGTECGATCNGVDPTGCKYPTGSKSCGANTCIDGVETKVSTCNGAGSCSGSPSSCGGFLCSTTACKATCTSNADCTTGYYCKSGACIVIEGLGTSCVDATTCSSGFCADDVCCSVGSCGTGKSCSLGKTKGVCASLNGTACKADAECASGHCADGVCCDLACNGACEACNKSGSEGKCVPIVGDPLTGHPSCSASPTDPTCGLRCDGTDGKACKYAPSTTSCGTPSCAGGIESSTSTCDGGGSCKPSSKSCGAYVCGATSCLTSCTSNADCTAGNYCKEGSCISTEALGNKCTDASQCKSGFCTDDVCCSVASCGEGSSCASGPGSAAGTCLKTNGVTCSKADECASGHCVDGVCCNTACNGQCEACAIKGSEGTCTAALGKPAGDRAACDTLADNDCAKQACDGVVRDKCNGFANGSATKCGAVSCTTDKKFQQVGTCDGKGNCALPDPKPCTPYACDSMVSSGCKSSCASDTDCADGFTCDSGTCIQGAKCSDDRLSSIDKAGNATSCVPYRCGTDGNCLKACASSDDCAPDTVCDTNVKACVGVAATGDEGGGCGTAPGRSASSAWWLAAVALSLARTRRRGSPRARRTRSSSS